MRYFSSHTLICANTIYVQYKIPDEKIQTGIETEILGGNFISRHITVKIVHTSNALF